MEKITVFLKPTRENIKHAAKALELGGIVIYPTESSYAIGCDFTNSNAVEEVMKIKKRKKSKHITVIVDSLETAKRYGKINQTAELIANRFMPGPLTICVPGKTKRINEFNFRISENSIAKLLAAKLGKPVVSTSANISGKENIYNSKELEPFFGKVDAVLDAGSLPHREVSTVIMVNEDKVVFKREGAVSKQKIKEFLKKVR